MVQLLVHASADVDAADNRKITPLMAAFRKVDSLTRLNLCMSCYTYFQTSAYSALPNISGSCKGGAVYCEGSEPVPIRH